MTDIKLRYSYFAPYLKVKGTPLCLSGMAGLFYLEWLCYSFCPSLFLKILHDVQISCNVACNVADLAM